MVSIQRLPTSIQSPHKPPRTNKPTQAPVAAEQTVVAKAVAKSVRDPELIQDAHSRIQYDEPEGGKHRQALDSYMGSDVSKPQG